MRSRILRSATALLAAAFLVAPAFAKPVAKNVRISQAAKVGKSQISAGEYRLLIDGSKVTVKKGNQVVAELEGRWEDREAKSAYDSYVLNRNGQLEEVRFQGESRVLILVNN